MSPLLINNDCRHALKEIDDESVDSIITDPPYGLSDPPDINKVIDKWIKGESHTHNKKGFMNKEWDSFVPEPHIWKECLRVLKPGGHLLSFFGTRTFDIGSLSIRLAGFEIRDTIMWVYGSGLSKSMNIEKAFIREANRIASHSNPDKMLESRMAEQSQIWKGWGTTLKPALEPVIIARKPLSEKRVIDNLLEHGCGAINIDECRVMPTNESKERTNEDSKDRRYTQHGSTNFAVKPGIRGGHPDGRLPSNLIHDGSEEVMTAFPEAPGQLTKASSNPDSPRTRKVYGSYQRSDDPMSPRGDKGSAARFFYCAKANTKDRNEGMIEGINDHNTVKPNKLMRYLCRLFTPPNGVILDPFMGSGSTGKAALQEGFHFIGIEMNESHFSISKQRIENTKISED